ncbi:MAG: efflux RND transporter periplasmic adaptor subunit [Reichenbachiella sp.]|uniref:efflux RND transporter periplasmic adaptor subunit n=1 Tax=Reichenbachiella sp. TaxID=2184521 RepID=UPI0032994FB6
MKKLTYIIPLILVFAISCSSDLETKKKEVEELKNQIQDLKGQVIGLEEEIRKEDPAYGKIKANKTLITVLDVAPRYFEHKIEVRGAIESRTNVTVSPQVPGKIVRVNVIAGQSVKKGQVLFSLDSEIIKNNVAELETALELANIMATKQENLWEKNIGTEVQYLQAKNNKESLERKLATAKSQLDQTRVLAPFSGTVDAMDAKIGEMAQPGIPLVRIVNPNDVHISSDVSERFIGKFKKADKVDIYFPSQDREMISQIASVGQVINSQNRTFEMEVFLPTLDFIVKPNQVVVLNLKDYENTNALVVPTKLIQKDNTGSFVYEIVKDGNNLISKKVYVKTGITFNNETEIIAGLKANQRLANKGFRDLSEGVVVSILKDNSAN